MLRMLAIVGTSVLMGATGLLRAEILLTGADRFFGVYTETNTKTLFDDDFFEMRHEHFAPVDETYTVTSSVDGALATAKTVQTSTIESTRFEATGLGISFVDTTTRDGFGQAFAETYYAIFFDVLEPTTWHLTGRLTSQGETFTGLQLEDPSFMLLLEFCVQDDEVELDEVVELTPGTYMFNVGIEAQAETEGGDSAQGEGEFEILFMPVAGTCIGDLDDSGNIGFDDLLVVLSAWGPCIGCPADLNGDDAVDFDDVLIVLSGWGPCA